MRLALLLVLLAAPSAADTVTRSLEAGSEREARALALLLAALSLHEHLEEGGSARDWAGMNLDALLDPGSADWALVEQRGEGHEATVTQEGGGNALLLLQLGAGAVADLSQGGDDGALVLQWGRPQP